jgi:hypothetical protein
MSDSSPTVWFPEDEPRVARPRAGEAFPRDLRAWLPANRLLEVLKLSAPSIPIPSPEAAMLWALAIGCEGTQDMVDASTLEPMTRYLSGGSGLTAIEVRQGRRRFRRDLQAALAAILTAAADSRQRPQLDPIGEAIRRIDANIRAGSLELE